MAVHSIPKVIKSTVFVIVQIKFELAYYDVAVQHISHLKVFVFYF